jgi:hypothetical protein
MISTTFPRTLLTLAAGVLFTFPLHAQQPIVYRTISGTVTDGSHEPLRGAAVELHNTASNAVTSRLTDADGHYTFKRLDGNADFTLRALYRGHESRIHTVGKFNNHMDMVVDFVIKSY